MLRGRFRGCLRELFPPAVGMAERNSTAPATSLGLKTVRIELHVPLRRLMADQAANHRHDIPLKTRSAGPEYPDKYQE